MFNTLRVHPSTRLVTPVFALSVLGILANGCGPSGSGILVEEEHTLEVYDSIVLANGFEGRVVMGDKYSVLITADDNVIEHVRVEYADGEVFVDFDKDSYRDATLKAEFTLPQVASIVVEDGSTMSAKGVEVEDNLALTTRDGSGLTFSLADDQSLKTLKLVVVDGSDIDFEGQSEVAKVTLEDGATLDMAGSGSTMDLSMHDGSSLNAKEYAVEELDCSLYDGASAKVRVSEEAKGSLKDGSTLELWGDASTRISVSDGSSLKHK